MQTHSRREQFTYVRLAMRVQKIQATPVYKKKRKNLMEDLLLVVQSVYISSHIFINTNKEWDKHIVEGFN